MYACVYIYIERERDRVIYIYMYTHMHTYIYDNMIIHTTSSVGRVRYGDPQASIDIGKAKVMCEED